MAQITWRNVDAPDLTGVARIGEVAGQNVRDALGRLVSLAGQQAAQDTANFGVARTQNTAALQNQLLGIQDPTQLAAQSADYSPEALRAQYGAQYDQGAINQILQQRPQQLRQDLTSQIQLEGAQKAQASQPFENQFYSLLAQDPNQAEAFLKQNQANFADTRQLFGDLTNRRNQIQQMALQQAQLGESRAARQAANAERTARAQESSNLRNYAQELNQWRLDNPDKPVGAKAAELQKQFNINPVQGNQVTAAVETNFAQLGKMTPEQQSAVNSLTTTNQVASEQFRQDALAEVNARFASAGLSSSLIDATKDTKTSQDDVIDKWGKRLGDVGEATKQYNAAKSVLGDVPPAVIDNALQNSSQSNTITDGVNLGRIWSTSRVEDNAKQIKQAIGDTSKMQLMRDALREVDNQANSLFMQAQAPVTSYSKKLAAFNLGQSTTPPVLQPVELDWTGARKTITNQIMTGLGDPTLNKETVRKRLNQ